MPDSSTRLRFDPEWRISLLTALLLPFLLVLGFWQLDRAEEKAGLANTFELRRAQAPASLQAVSELQRAELAYLPVKLKGSFLQDKYFLLDNRIYGGRFGYEVIGIFRLRDSGELVLLNRGWIAGDPARLSLPAVETLEGTTTVTGHIYISPGAPYLLAEQHLQDGWPKRIQALEMDKLLPIVADAGGGEVFPYPVRIDTGQQGALTVDWQIVNVSPEKHRGYAVQWFTMAIALGIFYILRSSNIWSLLASKKRKN